MAVIVVSIIQASNLVKEYRRPQRVDGFLGGVRTLLNRQHTVLRAVDGVSFDIDRGELVGYLGPNGAGKSTTIKMLTGILVPTSGQLEVAGIVPWRDRGRNARNIGVVFGQRTGLWWDLPLIDSLRLVQTIYEVPEATFAEQLGGFSELLGLSEFLGTPVRQLSLGQRMRGDLAAAMIPQPEILYLDEPTIGLDILAKQRIREFIAELNRSNRTTVVLTTHDIADVERLCTRIVLIDRGRVLFDGDVDRLKARYAPYRELVVHVADESVELDCPNASLVSTERGKLTLRFDPAELSVAALINQVVSRHEVIDLSVIEPSLEDIVARLYATGTAECVST